MAHFGVAILALCMTLSTTAICAQSPQMQPPAPSPEVKRLEFFVGKWRTEAEMKPGPWGPGSKASGSDNCSWMDGGFFVICNTEVLQPWGKLIGLGVLGYDATKRKYTRQSYHNDGQTVTGVGTFDGKSWVYISERVVRGRRLKSRFTFVETSSTSYDFKVESSQDGTSWLTVVEGSGTKS